MKSFLIGLFALVYCANAFAYVSTQGVRSKPRNVQM